LAIYTNNDPVRCYCFGCGRTATWSTLAEVLKLGKLDRDWNDPRAYRNLAKELQDLFKATPALPPNVRLWSYGKWRKFSSRVLSLARSLWWWDDRNRTRRIVWPVWDTASDLLGYVGRDLDGTSAKRYYNMPLMEVTGTLWPWPCSLAYPERSLVLVEGITDALRLLQWGMPALATLGTVWNKTRSLLVANLNVNRIVLAFDPDNAGMDLADRVAWQLTTASKLFEAQQVCRWDWSRGHDAGDAPVAEVKELRRQVLPPNVPGGVHPWLQMTPHIQQRWYSFKTPRE